MTETLDTVCSIQPYFKIKPGKREEFTANISKFVETTQAEDGMVFYSFAVNNKDDVAVCREGYKDGESVLAHLANIDALLKQALSMSDLIKLEVIAPPAELEKIKEALTPLGAEFFELQSGGVRRG